MMLWFYRINGVIGILGGIYLWLAFTGVIHLNPNDSEREALGRRKFGKLVKIIAPLLILFGILELCGLFDP